jgi:hypothetical protein
MKDSIKVTLTREQAKELATLLTIKTGELQYRAVQTPDGSLDDSWAFWNDLTKNVAFSMGYEAYSNPETDYVQDLLSL